MRPGWRSNSVHFTITVLIALAMGTIAPSAANAQPAVTWELLGQLTNTNRFTALAFRPGSSPDGSLDTLYVGSTLYLYRYPPGGPLSAPIHEEADNEFVIATTTGALLAGRSPGQLHRSTDGGGSWNEVHSWGTGALLQSTAPSLGGAVFSGTSVVWASESDGEAGTWEQRGSPGDVASFQDVTAGPHAGRLLAGWWGGASYSNDGGSTWTAAGLWPYRVYSMVFHPDPAHPAGGVAYATGSTSRRASLFRSDDAGASWLVARAFQTGDYGFEEPHEAFVAVGADGLVWVGLSHLQGGAQPRPGTIIRSADGGQTWDEVTEGYGGWGVNALAFGRDGRLYLAADRGVWRTTSPVVAGEPPAPGARLSIGVAPNPARDVAEITVDVAEAGHLDVGIYDTLGRRIATLHAGAVAPGAHRFTWGADAARGVYFVRATVAGRSARAALTLR